MYTHHMNGLGEEPAAASPSLWDSFSNLLTKGVSAGFNIYNKVQNLTTQQKAATVAQQQAQQLAQYTAMYGRQPVPGQPAYGQPVPFYPGQQPAGFFDGWTMPLLLAGAAVVGVVLLRRK